ncbi:hypothetical protein, partial [Aliivibrio fischeri]|uniref:hypothetical protein n=1 Tax=Aliivibrio fischeri TaxID=668 RepID=UPI001BE493E1
NSVGHTKIKQLKIVVPPRGKERTTDHCEQWQIYYLLKCLFDHGLVCEPFRLTKRESPDFKVEMSNLAYGIEATEAINLDFKVYLSLIIAMLFGTHLCLNGEIKVKV